MPHSENVDDSYTNGSDSDATANEVHGSKEGSASNTNINGSETYDKSGYTVVPKQTAATELGEALARTTKSAKEHVKSLSVDLRQLENYQALVDMNDQRLQVSRLQRQLDDLTLTVEQRDVQIENLSQEVSDKDEELANEEEKTSQLMKEWEVQEEELESTQEELGLTQGELQSTKKDLISAQREVNLIREELDSLRKLVVGVQEVFTRK
jgi:chromosome segregation ATPase